MRPVSLLRLYEGTSDIQRLIIGGAMFRNQQASRPGASA
jgi:alkylation response protein AidB-like acyl-CoA dehydrogenase